MFVFDSAKVLRGGAQIQIERLQRLTPVIEELFHIEKDILEVITITDSFFLLDIGDLCAVRRINMYPSNWHIMCATA